MARLLWALLAFPLVAQIDSRTQVKNQPVLDTRTYDFVLTPQMYSGSLASAGAKTVTIAAPFRCPAGMTGSHRFLVTDGSNSEVVTRTGGTCTAGGTGTLQFTTTLTYTLPSLRSATAGIQEACNTGQFVNIPAGSYDIYDTITPTTGCKITGAGSSAYSGAATILTFHSADQKLFNVVNDNVFIRDVHLLQHASVTALAGNIAVYIAGAGSGVSGATANWGELNAVTITGFYHGVYNQGDGGQWDLHRVFITNSQSTGAVALGAQGWWSFVTVQFSGMAQTDPSGIEADGHGVYVAPCPSNPNCGTSPWFSGLQTFSNYGWGLYVDGAGLTVSGSRSYFNNDRAGEVYASASGSLSNFSIENAGMPAAPFSANATATGLEIGPAASNLHVFDGIIDHINGIGVLVNGGGTIFNSVNVFDVGVGGVAGTEYAWKIANDNTTLNSCQAFEDPVLVTGANFPILTNNLFLGGTSDIPSLKVTGTSTAVHLDQNLIVNSDSGISFECDSGSTLLDGDNSYSGTQANNCTRYSGAFANFTTTLKTVTFANLGGGGAGTAYWCSDCAIGAACAGSGSGAIAISNGGSWMCVGTSPTFQFPTSAFADLGGGEAGTAKYCTDCQVADPCTDGGTGALAVSNGGQWECK